MRSPWGRVVRGIREDEDATASLGKNVFLYKLQSLVLGGALGALAGMVLAIDQQNIDGRGNLAHPREGARVTRVPHDEYVVVRVDGVGRAVVFDPARIDLDGDHTIGHRTQTEVTSTVLAEADLDHGARQPTP